MNVAVRKQTDEVEHYQTLFGSEISADSMNTGVAAAAACIMTIVVVAVSTISRKSIKDDGYEL